MHNMACRSLDLYLDGGVAEVVEVSYYRPKAQEAGRTLSEVAVAILGEALFDRTQAVSDHLSEAQEEVEGYPARNDKDSH